MPALYRSSVDRRRFWEPPPDAPEATTDTEFESLFQRFMHGEIDAVPMNEDIERIYRHLKRHTPEKCPHGKTTLTCAECYFNQNWGGRGWAL